MNNIRVVLVNTTHPGNIGAAARAMKTMGLRSLYLVAPKRFPDVEATAMAAGAEDVLQQAIVVNTLQEAIADCQLVVATSARSRARPWPMLTPRELGEKVNVEKQHEIAIVFGRESSGLSNEELQLAHFHVQIPSAKDYGSLNVAQAVQVLCYEIRVAQEGDQPITPTLSQNQYPSSKMLEDFYQHLEVLLTAIEFIDSSKPMHQMQKLRRIFAKSRLELSEVNLLRGVLSDIQQSIDLAKK